MGPDLAGMTATARPLTDVLNEEAQRLLIPLFGSVALVFLVAAVNVAGLFVARGLQRHREYAMRGALGASRLRLFRQVLTESAVVAMLGAVGGAVRRHRSGQAVHGHRRHRYSARGNGDGRLAGVRVRPRSGGARGAGLAGSCPRWRAAAPEHGAALKGSRSSGRATTSAGSSPPSPRCRSCSRWRS